ncbi:hypothetical protein [Flavobacterium piscis]|nr:hypothetical protein [Flavobacterium piscis]
MDDMGVPGINLLMDQLSRINTSIIGPNAKTDTFHLQEALRRLTRNDVFNRNIDSIGLLFADRFYGHAGVFGYMFDQGFDPEGIERVDQVFHMLPREGCVVFLDEIRDHRNSGDYANEVMFTAIHELGHVFNLWHIEDKLNFMKTSSPDRSAYGSEAQLFTRNHRLRLHNATDPYVRPGGKPYSTWGMGGPPANNPFKETQKEQYLKLEIEILQNEFWYFEPIEMDIRLSAIVKGKVFEVPDELDPGYERFCIYITRPDGTVTKYKSTKHFCHNNGTLKISSGEGFQRDISIFGQSGGYTFEGDGLYSVECFFKPYQTWIRSNTIEVNVKSPLPRSQSYSKIKNLFSNSQTAKLLYYRSGYYSQEIIRELTQQSKKKRGGHLTANLSYALACYISKYETAGNSSKKLAALLVNNALDSGNLSLNRTKNLLKLNERMELR